MFLGKNFEAGAGKCARKLHIILLKGKTLSPKFSKEYYHKKDNFIVITKYFHQ